MLCIGDYYLLCGLLSGIWCLVLGVAWVMLLLRR